MESWDISSICSIEDRDNKIGSDDDMEVVEQSDKEFTALEHSYLEIIRALLQRILLQSTYISSCLVESEPTIKQCMTLLSNTPGIEVGDELYCYACALMCKKDFRAVFVAIPTSEARKNWLEYMHATLKANHPPPTL